MNEENTRIANMMGFFTETPESGEINYYYEDPYTGLIEELTEFRYYSKMTMVVRGADQVERICVN